MASITLSIEHATLKAARAYASEQGWSLDELILRVLQTVVESNPDDELEATFKRADRLNLKSGRA